MWCGAGGRRAWLEFVSVAVSLLLDGTGSLSFPRTVALSLNEWSRLSTGLTPIAMPAWRNVSFVPAARPLCSIGAEPSSGVKVMVSAPAPGTLKLVALYWSPCA